MTNTIPFTEEHERLADVPRTRDSVYDGVRAQLAVSDDFGVEAGTSCRDKLEHDQYGHADFEDAGVEVDCKDVVLRKLSFEEAFLKGFELRVSLDTFDKQPDSLRYVMTFTSVKLRSCCYVGQISKEELRSLRRRGVAKDKQIGGKRYVCLASRWLHPVEELKEEISLRREARR